MLCSGGTDFHGKTKPGLELITGYENVNVQIEDIENWIFEERFFKKKINIIISNNLLPFLKKSYIIIVKIFIMLGWVIFMKKLYYVYFMLFDMLFDMLFNDKTYKYWIICLILFIIIYIIKQLKQRKEISSKIKELKRKKEQNNDILNEILRLEKCKKRTIFNIIISIAIPIIILIILNIISMVVYAIFISLFDLFDNFKIISF